MPQSSLLAWLSNKSTTVTTSRHVEVTNGDGETTCSTSSFEQEVRSEPEQSTSSETTTTTRVMSKSSDQPSLPQNVEFRACEKSDIAHLKRLTGLLLPIPYPESFYREIIQDPLVNNITLLALWHDDPRTIGTEKGRLVGAVRCRILNQQATVDASSTAPMLYLSTLVLLSPYRGHGIATHLLDHVTRRAIRDHGVTNVGAHVWTANVDGLEWYRKRGFTEVAREAAYYPRLHPQDAVVVQRRLSVIDLLGD